MPLGTGMASCCCRCPTYLSEDFTPDPGTEGPPWPLPSGWEGEGWTVGRSYAGTYHAQTSQSGTLWSLKPIDHSATPAVRAEFVFRGATDGLKLRWLFGSMNRAPSHYVELEFLEGDQTPVRYALYRADGTPVRAPATGTVDARGTVWLGVCLWEDTTAAESPAESSEETSGEASRRLTVTLEFTGGSSGSVSAVLGTVPINDELGTTHGVGVEFPGQAGGFAWVENYIVKASERADCPTCPKDCGTCLSDDPPPHMVGSYSGVPTVGGLCECLNGQQFWLTYFGICHWRSGWILCYEQAQACLVTAMAYFSREPVEGGGDQWVLYLEWACWPRLGYPSPGTTVAKWKSQPLGSANEKLNCNNLSGVVLRYVSGSLGGAADDSTVTLSASDGPPVVYAVACGCQSFPPEEVEFVVEGLQDEPGCTAFPCAIANGSYILQLQDYSYNRSIYRYDDGQTEIEASFGLFYPPYSSPDIVDVQAVIRRLAPSPPYPPGTWQTLSGRTAVDWPNCSSATIEEVYDTGGPTCCRVRIVYPMGVKIIYGQFRLLAA